MSNKANELKNWHIMKRDNTKWTKKTQDQKNYFKIWGENAKELTYSVQVGVRGLSSNLTLQGEGKYHVN
jgi:hypothetical protein